MSYPDSIAMRCLLEEMRDNPGAIAPGAMIGAAAWALGRIKHLEDLLKLREPTNPNWPFGGGETL